MRMGNLLRAGDRRRGHVAGCKLHGCRVHATQAVAQAVCDWVQDAWVRRLCACVHAGRAWVQGPCGAGRGAYSVCIGCGHAAGSKMHGCGACARACRQGGWMQRMCVRRPCQRVLCARPEGASERTRERGLQGLERHPSSGHARGRRPRGGVLRRPTSTLGVLPQHPSTVPPTVRLGEAGCGPRDALGRRRKTPARVATASDDPQEGRRAAPRQASRPRRDPARAGGAGADASGARPRGGCAVRPEAARGGGRARPCAVRAFCPRDASCRSALRATRRRGGADAERAHSGGTSRRTAPPHRRVNPRQAGLAGPPKRAAEKSARMLAHLA